jgi:hypothetical protein
MLFIPSAGYVSESGFIPNGGYVSSSGAATRTATGALIAGNSSFSGNAKRILSLIGVLQSANSTLSGVSIKTLKSDSSLSISAPSQSGIADRIFNATGIVISDNSAIEGFGNIIGINSAIGVLSDGNTDITSEAMRSILSDANLISSNSLQDGVVTIIGFVTSSGNIQSESSANDGAANKNTLSSGNAISGSTDVVGVVYKKITASGDVYTLSININGVITAIDLKLDQIEWVLVEYGLNLVVIEQTKMDIMTEQSKTNIISG